MALTIADRIKETTTTTGTGTYTLAGAADGFESFAEIGDGNTTYYVCTGGADFEVGIGTYTASGTTLARTTILQSSNADAAVNWTAGDKTIFCTVPAEKYIFQDASGNTALAGDLTFGDNDKAIFGAGSDLQIYHDGSDSYVRDNGTGDLYIEGSDDIRFRTTSGQTYAVFNENSSVNLYHNNTLKFETSATGVDVLSTDATVNFVSSRGTGATHTITTGGANSGNFNINAASGGDIYINAENKIFRNAAGSSEHMRIDSSGNVGIGTSSPTEALDVRGQSVFGSGTDGVKLTYSAGNSTGIIDTGFTSTGLEFRIGNSFAAKIDSSGNVGIGTSSPSFILDATGDVDTWVSRIYNTGSDANAQGLLVRSDATAAHDALALGVYADSGYKFVVKSSGNVDINSAGITTSAGLQVESAVASSSPIVAKSGTYDTVWGVLPWSGGKTFFSTGLYYDNGSWVHASDNSYNALLAFSGDDGGQWYASDNSTGSWNIASNRPLWNNAGQWNGDINTTADINVGSMEISSTNPTIRLFETDTSNLNTQLQNNIGKFTILTTNDAATSGSTRFQVDHATGDIFFYSSSGNADLTWDASSSSLLMSDAGTITKASKGGETSSVYIGKDAGNNSPSTFASYNTFIGNSAGTAATGSTYSTFIGGLSGDFITTGDDLTMVGYETDGMNGTVTDSVCIGYRARGGSYGVSVGHLSQYSGSSGSQYCTTVGRVSGYDMDGGDYCVFVGYRSGYAGGTGNDNVGIGSYSADALTSGYDNTCMGHSAGGAITTGYNNVCVGHTSGTNISSGNTIVCVGHDAGSTYAGSSNCTNLGNGANAPVSSATNTITLGNSSISSLRCNTTSISSLSDERDKTAIEDIPYGLDFINAMRPVEFTWNRRDGSMGATKDIGFIAQELAEVEMDFSSTNRTRMVSFDNPEKWEAAPNRTYPILIKAVQELSAKCEALEARIQQLEQGN